MRKLPTDLVFKMEHQFTLYLQRSGVTRAQLPPDQYREMRRAFYGGLSQMFFLISQDVPNMKERHSCQTLTNIQEQLGKFWDRETELQEKDMQEFAPQSPVFCDCGWAGIVADLVKPVKDGPDKLCRCPVCASVQLNAQR